MRVWRRRTGAVRRLEMTEFTDEDSQQTTLRQAQAEMLEAGKQETLDIFSELLERLWERIVGLIGGTATVAVFRSALLEASRDHPLCQEINIDSGGICLDRLKKNLDALERTAVRAGLMAFTDNVMALLIDLTGGILLRKVEPLVQQLKQQLEKG